MNIKILTSDDWEMFRDIRLAGLKNAPQAFGGSFNEESQRGESEWRERLENPDKIFIAVEEAGSLLALVGSSKNSEGYWLIAVYTLPEARGRGYSQVLTSKIVDEVKKRGADSIQLIVNTDQTDAVHLYKKAGFEIIKTIDEEKMGDGKLHSSYLMSKKLT